MVYSAKDNIGGKTPPGAEETSDRFKPEELGTPEESLEDCLRDIDSRLRRYARGVMGAKTVSADFGGSLAGAIIYFDAQIVNEYVMNGWRSCKIEERRHRKEVTVTVTLTKD